MALGIFEGHMAKMAKGFKAIRQAKLELNGGYNPEEHDDFLTHFDWKQFSDEEWLLCPPVVAVGGDGAMYDIGFQNLSRAMASGIPIKVMVLDTQVYSNTGGQVSKATPRSAVAKFAASGKPMTRKDLGLASSVYGNVYVAQVAIGANDQQTLKAFIEADAWTGPSLIIAYSSCIAHGIDMSKSMTHQGEAVRSCFWPLYRYHPGVGPHQHPFQLDSRRPSIPVRNFTCSEARFAMLERSDPERARRLLELLQADSDERWRFYEQVARVERTIQDEALEEGRSTCAEPS